jgi:hypothetical protein
MRSWKPRQAGLSGPGGEAADQRRTMGSSGADDTGVVAARRVRLVADGGGLENR